MGIDLMESCSLLSPPLDPLLPPPPLLSLLAAGERVAERTRGASTPCLPSWHRQHQPLLQKLGVRVAAAAVDSSVDCRRTHCGNKKMLTRSSHAIVVPNLN